MKEEILYRLALLLTWLGFTRRRWMWEMLEAVAPTFAGALVIMEQMSQPSEHLLWLWPGPGHEVSDEEISGLVSAVSEVVNRAPTPMGGDEYLISIGRYGPLPGEEQGVDPSAPGLLRSLERRALAEKGSLTGSRWHDWKRGQGKEELRQALREMAPNAETPVVVVHAVVAGALVAQAVEAMK